MSKSKIYTMVSLLLAAAFIVGSMAGMNLILEAREKHLLSEKGKAILESPVRAWQKEETESEKTGEVEGEELENIATAESENSMDAKEALNQKGYKLELWQMENSICHWQESVYHIPHEPVEGQISMEEAIEIGKGWLLKMGLEENDKTNVTIEIEDLVETDNSVETSGLHSLTASLSVGSIEGNAEPLEPYYSFWNIWFSKEDMNVDLLLNAVTGEVWRAFLIWNGELTEELPYVFGEKLWLFAEIAGVKPLEDGPYMDIGSESCYAFLRLKDTQMYAKMTYHKIVNHSTDYIRYATTVEGAMITYSMVID